MVLVAALISLYLTFSPLGIVSGHLTSGWYLSMGLLWTLALVIAGRSHLRHKPLLSSRTRQGSLPLDNN